MHIAAAFASLTIRVRGGFKEEGGWVPEVPWILPLPSCSLLV